MKEIYTACGIGKEFLTAGVNPACTVTGNYFNPCPLFWRKQAAEFCEDIVSVVFVNPDDTIPVHVVDHGDVFIAFSVGSLIHTDSAYIIMDSL